MAKIERKNQKIFSGNNTSETGIFGSAQSGSSGTNPDLDVLQSLPAYERGWGDAVISGEELPPLEEFNGLNYINTSQLSYLFQEGIAEYNVDTTYYINSIVKETGTVNLYKSLTDDNIGNALSDIVNWQLLGDLSNIAQLGTAAFEDTGVVDGTVPLIGVGDKLSSSLLEDATETVKGVAEVATQVETDSGILDDKIVTPLKLENKLQSLGNTVKGWVNFNASGGVSINDSFNVSSVTDFGTGNYGINWTNSFSNSNYVVVGICRPTPPTASAVVQVNPNIALTPSQARITVYINTATPSPELPFNVYIAAFGN